VTERAGKIEVEKRLDATGEMHREEFGYQWYLQVRFTPAKFGVILPGLGTSVITA
jgi:hypothetical protein